MTTWCEGFGAIEQAYPADGWRERLVGARRLPPYTRDSLTAVGSAGPIHGLERPAAITRPGRQIAEDLRAYESSHPDP